MNYETTFLGELAISPTLTPEHRKTFKAVLAKATFSKDPARQKERPLQLSSDGTTLAVADKYLDAGNFNHWLTRLIVGFLGPQGYSLSGTIRWIGCNPEDRGMVFVRENRVEEVQDFICNPGPSWAPVPFASDHMVTLIRSLVLSADATGCSDEVTTVNADALRPFQYLLRCENLLTMKVPEPTTLNSHVA